MKTNSSLLLLLAATALARGGTVSLPAPEALPPGCSCPSLHHRPDFHAPAGVMGDHTHARGKWMFSYRPMFMSMGGMRDGTTDLSTADIHARHMVAPTGMTMEMHMLGIMYAPSDRLTLMLMTNYQRKEMDHLTRPGSMAFMMNGPSFTRKEEGWGDTTLAALWLLNPSPGNRLHLNLGLSIPTAGDSPLPYPMQNGSGTWDLKPGLTWVSLRHRYSLGAQLTGTLRLEEENDRGYRFPNQIEATAWAAKPLTPRLSLSARLTYIHQGSFHGADKDITAIMSPHMDPANLPADRLDLSLGLNAILRPGMRIAIEAGAPVHENTDGPRLSTDWWAAAALKFSW